MQPNQNSKTRILFLAANPRDLTSLRLGEEIRTIEERLRLAEFRDHFEVEQCHALRYSDLTEALLRYKPHIVHFSGHGSSSGEIMLESETGGTHPVSPSTLQRLFGLLKDNIRCVVLNACWSAHQAAAIASEIGCVVGMERAITDKGAIQFASGFYQGLAYGRDLETAFQLGRAQIDLSGLRDSAIPHLKSGRGIQPKSIVFVKSEQSVSVQQNSATPSRSVFISYSRKDRATTEQIAHQLRAHGYKVWTDVTGIPGGAVWHSEIERAIRGCDALIVVLSDAAKQSEWVLREILFASDLAKPIYPLCIEDVRPPFALYDRQLIEYFRDPTAAVDELLSGLSQLVSRTTLTSDPSNKSISSSTHQSAKALMSLVDFRKWIAH